MKLIKILTYIISLCLIILILYANSNLYYKPKLISTSDNKIEADLLQQLKHLEMSIDAGVALEMQKQYPEGFFFSYLLYGLTWCEITKDLPEESSIKNHAILQAIKSLNNLESDLGKQNFTQNLSLPHGAFYFGWINYLKAKMLSSSVNFKGRDNIEKDYISGCLLISEAINKSKSPYLESYPNLYWPSDMIPAVAALKLYDKMFLPKYDSVIINWLQKVKNSQLLSSGLIPHQVDKNGSQIKAARGSSQSLILIILAEISEQFAKEQFTLYKARFSNHFLFMPMIKEYSAENNNTEDVDSGPILFGNGSVATIAGAGTFKRFGEITTSTRMYQTLECIGFPYTNGNGKKYLGGLFPMADFFIAWTKSQHTIVYKTSINKNDSLWRLPFHLLSSVFVALLLLPFYNLLKFQKKTKSII